MATMSFVQSGNLIQDLLLMLPVKFPPKFQLIWPNCFKEDSI